MDSGVEWPDLDLILSHYTEDFVKSSPHVAVVAGEPSGALQGKKAIGAYWEKALKQAPDLCFELVSTMVGADSVTVYYKGARGVAAKWNFRVVRKKKVYKVYIDPTNKKERVDYTYTIHEAYYDKNGHVGAITQEPVEPFGENIEELRHS